MIGPSGLYGLGLYLGIAKQLPGKEVICHVCIHPVHVDRWCDYMAWQIKGPVVVIMLDRDENNSPQRCACMRGTSLVVLSAGRIPIMVIGPVDCFDWMRVCGTVDFSPGGVRIGEKGERCVTDLQLMLRR